MGLIKFFKKLLDRKVIQMKPSKQNILIQAQSSKLSVIKLGQKIMVEKGYSAVIVAKDRVLDVFFEGTHEISLAYIPKTTKLLKLDHGKVVKHGMVAEAVLPTKFKCDLYYVKTEEILNRMWKSGKVKVREKGKKRFHFSMQGNYSFQITDPAKVVEFFLIDWARIVPGKELKKLDMLVGDEITEALWRKKIKSKDELTEYDMGNNVIKPAIFKTFNKYGICINDIVVENIIYPENLKSKTYQNVEAEKLENAQEATNNSEIESKEDLIEYENHNIAKTENLEQTKIPYKSFEESKFKCPNCGQELDISSIFCNKCGTKLKED
ncbi:MAG: SPFH domain-containing protein [Clostridia bacterium]|nr:SPFH domain-containing protein [Clostridia bacterium]